MRLEVAEISLSMLLREFAQTFGIAYAVLVRFPTRNSLTLILRFMDSDRYRDRLSLILDFITLLPPIPINVYDFDSLPEEFIRYSFKHGKIMYVGSYEIYMRDLEKLIGSDPS